MLLRAAKKCLYARRTRKLLFNLITDLGPSFYKVSELHYFSYKDGVLCADDIPLTQIADEVSTPFYCYSETTLRRHINVFSSSFGDADILTAYSVKANSNLAVLKVLASEGAGADVVSGGELVRATRAGIPGEKIVFSGVGKTDDEIRLGLSHRIHQFNVESDAELERIDAIATSMGCRAPVAFRVNPDVDAGTHEKISTGRAEVKFGIAWSDAPRLYEKAAGLKGIAVKGVDVHIGSQISDLGPFENAFRKVAQLVQQLRGQGHSIERVDLGGGLGIPYGDDDVIPPHPSEYANLIRKIADPLQVQLIFEPGRMIVGNAGVLVSSVIFVKPGESRNFLILDAGMNDLIRPALYDAWHELRPVMEGQSAEMIEYDVVGPICETGDRFAQRRKLPEFKRGDLVAFMSAGAYGAVQASEYNSRPLIPEVLVSGSEYQIIRKRPTLDEMLDREIMPNWL